MNRGWLKPQDGSKVVEDASQEQRNSNIKEYSKKIAILTDELNAVENKLKEADKTLKEKFLQREKELDNRDRQLEELKSLTFRNKEAVEVKERNLSEQQKLFEEKVRNFDEYVKQQNEYFENKAVAVEKTRDGIDELRQQLIDKIKNQDVILSELRIQGEKIKEVMDLSRKEQQENDLILNENKKNQARLDNLIAECEQKSALLSKKTSEAIDARNKADIDMLEAKRMKEFFEDENNKVNRKIEFLKEETFKFHEYKIMFEANLRKYKDKEIDIKQKEAKLNTLKETVEQLILNKEGE